jgi:hypothetical protein
VNTLLIEWLQSSEEARLETEFEAIWDIYPKRVRKGAAVKAYIATRRKGVSFSVLLDATKGYKQDRKGEEAKYTERASTFFGDEAGWKDHSAKTNGQTKPKRKDGQWAPEMTRDLQAMARREDEEEATRDQTTEGPTTDPSPTTESVEDQLKNL